MLFSRGDVGWRVMLATAAVLALLVFVYPLCLDVPLLDPGEGVHAVVSQEMVQSGDWITPCFLGRPFFDKPILYFWCQAASMRLFGVDESAVRLPGLLLGLLGAVTTAMVGGRMFGRTVGLVAGMFYATMILPTALAQAASHDVALIPAVNLALLLLWESDRAQTRGARAGCTAAAGVLLGLMVLTKGLAGVALAGVAYGSYLLLTRRLTAVHCLRGGAALAVAALVAMPWYLAVEQEEPGFLYYYFIDRHLLGFATGSQIHGGQPWWYYVPILLGGGLPWIGYLPITIRDNWLRRKAATAGDSSGGAARVLASAKGDSPIFVPPLRVGVRKSGQSPSGAMPLLWCWLIGGTLLLSISSSKLATYLWPVFPPVAILAAVAWGRLIEGTLTDAARARLGRSLLISSLAGPLAPASALAVAQWAFAVELTWQAWAVTLAAGCAAWLPPLLWRSGRPAATLCTSTLTAALQFAAIMTFVMPQVAAANSARDLAVHFNRLGSLPPRLLVADQRIGTLLFYLDDDLRAGLKPGQLRQVKMAGLRRLAADTVVALPERVFRRVSRQVDLSGVDCEWVGRYRLYTSADLEPRLAAARERDSLQRLSNASNNLGIGPTRRNALATRQPTAAANSTSLR